MNTITVSDSHIRRLEVAGETAISLGCYVGSIKIANDIIGYNDDTVIQYELQFSFEDILSSILRRKVFSKYTVFNHNSRDSLMLHTSKINIWDEDYNVLEYVTNELTRVYVLSVEKEIDFAATEEMPRIFYQDPIFHTQISINISDPLEDGNYDFHELADKFDLKYALVK